VKPIATDSGSAIDDVERDAAVFQRRRHGQSDGTSADHEVPFGGAASIAHSDGYPS